MQPVSGTDSPSSSIVTSYGHDLNRDFEILSRLEQLTGFDLDPEDLANALTVTRSRLGPDLRGPSVRQLSHIIMDELRVDCAGGSTCSHKGGEDGMGGRGSGLNMEGSPSDSLSWSPVQDGYCSNEDQDNYRPSASPKHVARPNARLTPSVPALKLRSMRMEVGTGLQTAPSGVSQPALDNVTWSILIHMSHVPLIL